MQRQNFNKWYSQSLAGMLDNLLAQDRYLNMNAASLLAYARQCDGDLQSTIPTEDTGDKTVGQVIQSAVAYRNLAMEEADPQAITEETDMLYALLILPFVQWIVRTRYLPKQEFLGNVYLTECYEDPDEVMKEFLNIVERKAIL
ncbi:MAG: hypothetical protein NC124_03465 [Clostridium sp.]|nr:hypothetical protein [Clostridium sp.]